MPECALSAQRPRRTGANQLLSGLFLQDAVGKGVFTIFTTETGDMFYRGKISAHRKRVVKGGHEHLISYCDGENEWVNLVEELTIWDQHCVTGAWINWWALPRFQCWDSLKAYTPYAHSAVPLLRLRD
jgi:hypothetical protein